MPAPMVTVDRSGLTTFRFTCPRAGRLCLVGDFNNWDRTARPMQRAGEGVWTARMWLAGGTYQFKYYADTGLWYNDHAAFGLAHGPFGWNSTVVIPSAEHHAQSLLPPYRRPPLPKRRPRNRAGRIPPSPADALSVEQLRAILPAVLQ